MSTKLKNLILLFIFIGITTTSCADTWVIKEGPNRIERVGDSDGYTLNFYSNKQLYASFYQTPHGPIHSGYNLELKNRGITIISPYHFDKNGQLYTYIKSTTGTRAIEIGESVQVAPNVWITKFGLIKLFGHVLTPAGFAFISERDPKNPNSKLVKLIHPRNSNNATNLSDKLIPRVKEALNFLSKHESAPFEQVAQIISNAESRSSEDPLFPQLRASGGNCEAVPDCCCKPSERAADGKCYKPTLLVAGAFGGTQGFESILEKIKSLPCMKNTKFFSYEDDDTINAPLAELADEAALNIMNLSEECGGSPVTTHGYCHGGRILEQAMGLLAESPEIKYSINTYNSAYKGTYKIYPFLNILSFGIVGLFLSPTIRDYMNNNLPPPNDLAPNVTSFEAFVAGDDHDFSVESQRAGPPGADYVLDQEGNHYTTLPRNFEYIMCCGDGVVEAGRGEECEGSGISCNSTGLCGGLPLVGTCNDECKCLPDYSTCSDVSVEPSPSPSATQIE